MIMGYHLLVMCCCPPVAKVVREPQPSRVVDVVADAPSVVDTGSARAPPVPRKKEKIRKIRVCNNVFA